MLLLLNPGGHAAPTSFVGVFQPGVFQAGTFQAIPGVPRVGVFQLGVFQPAVFQAIPGGQPVEETGISFEGGSLSVPSERIKREELLAAYDAWIASLEKPKAKRPGKVQRVVKKAVKETIEVIEREPEFIDTTALTQALLDAAHGALKLSQLAIEANQALDEALALQAELDDEETLLLLVA